MAVASTLPHRTHTKSSGPLPLNTGRSGSSCTAVPPSDGTSPARTSRMVTVAIARPSERGELAGEVLDEGVEHAGHHALPHRRRLAGDLRVCVQAALAVGEREGHIGVGVAVAALLLETDAQDRSVGRLVLLHHLHRALEP